MTRAAGMMLLCGDKALFVKRADTGQWAFPGGDIDGTETAEEAAEREIREELGPTAHGNPKLLMRRIKDDGWGEVDFTTFVAKTEAEFAPDLNDEHTAWTWAPVADPPLPLHPGVAASLVRLGADELGVARLIVSGDLVSPQQYGSFWLWSIRITGTGFAYRDAHDEYCFRPEQIYLNEEFLARCNGLPVIFVHPEKKSKLDSEEFNNRIVGTVFVPFLKGTEVWAVCRIYDADTIDILRSEDFSTSPGVVFGADSGNYTLKTNDETDLLIEGKPALLDHIALVPAGVWDKGGPATGVDSIGVIMAEEHKEDGVSEKLDAIMDSLKSAHTRMDAMNAFNEERKDAEEREKKEREDHARKDAARKDRCDMHRKDRFGARKDGESFKDWGKRHDADEMAMCDAMKKDGAEEEESREDAKRARMDAEEKEKGEGGESFKKWAEEEDKESEHKEDKKDARKDGEDKSKEEEMKPDARHDALVGENAELKRRLAAVEARFTPLDPEERNMLARAQARADGIAGLFGKRATAPIAGESSIDYRRRLANDFKQHSARYKDKALTSLDSDMLGLVEEQIYADAAITARSPDRAGAGVLIPIREPDETGRMITRWTGDNMAWMQHYMSGARVGKINRNPNQNN